MKELVVNIVNVNLGFVGPGAWLSNEWEIYTDLTVEKKTRYKGNEEVVVKTSKISRWTYNSILRKLKAARKKDKQLEAYDGDVWAVVQYKNGKEIWVRNKGYIYGIKPFENLAIKLYKSNYE